MKANFKGRGNMREFIENCNSNLIIGIYKAGKKLPEKEISIPETLDFSKRKRITNELCTAYPKSCLAGFWCLSEDTIAANFYA